MDLILFIEIPLCAGFFQYLLARSRAPRWIKWCPAVVASLIVLLGFLGMIGVPLPESHWLGDSFFPDHFVLGIFALPALFGFAVGAGFAQESKPKK